MEVGERIIREQAFHDRQAGARAAFFRKDPAQLIVRENQYLDHEPWIRPALARIGELQGRRVLDFGCGHGMAAIVLAKWGARVTAFDLSGGYVGEARARARANRAAVDFVQANGEYLPFADETFDYIWGNAVLHHLNLRRGWTRAGARFKTGASGRLHANRGPAIRSSNWARKHCAYPGKERTPEEMPLTRTELDQLAQIFPRMDIAGYELFSMLGRVWGRGAVVRVTLAWWDRPALWPQASLLSSAGAGMSWLP